MLYLGNIGRSRRTHHGGRNRKDRLRRRRREVWERNQFLKKELGLGDLPRDVLLALPRFLPDPKDQLAWLQANPAAEAVAAEAVAAPQGQQAVPRAPRAGIKALVVRIRDDRTRAAAAARDRRYASAVEDTRRTAREGGGYADDLLEVSDYEAEDKYSRALAAYKQALARGEQGAGFRKIARKFSIAPARLQRMYNRDCERLRLAMEGSSDDSGSGPC